MVPDHPGGDPEVPRGRRSQKKKRKKKFPEKPDLPDPDPDFRISAHAVAIGAERATCSQNFRPLAAVVPETHLRSLAIIKYRICPPFQAMLTPVQLFLPRQRLCMTRTKFMNMWPDWPVNKRKSSFMDTRWEPPSVVSSWLSFAGKTGEMALRGLASCPGLTTNTILFLSPFFFC